jgi:hypothetical protein
MKQTFEDQRTTDSTPFTPRMPNGRRLKNVTHGDVELVSGSMTLRGLGHQAVVTMKGVTYNLVGTDCGLGSNCACDARLELAEAQAA